MCLIIDWPKHRMCRDNMKDFRVLPEKLKEDMEVYKLLIKIDNKLITPFQKMFVASGKGWGEINCPSFTRDDFSVSVVARKHENGYHSYASSHSQYLLDMAKGLSEDYDVYLCKCIIPKGSYVYYGVHDDICSNSLVIKEEDVKLYHKGGKKIIVNTDIIL